MHFVLSPPPSVNNTFTTLTFKRVLTFYTPSFVFQAQYCDHVNFVHSLLSVNNSVIILTFKRVWTFFHTIIHISSTLLPSSARCSLTSFCLFFYNSVSQIILSGRVHCHDFFFALQKSVDFFHTIIVSQAHYCHHVHFVLSPLSVYSFTTLSIKSSCLVECIAMTFFCPSKECWLFPHHLLYLKHIAAIMSTSFSHLFLFILLQLWHSNHPAW